MKAFPIILAFVFVCWGTALAQNEEPDKPTPSLEPFEFAFVHYTGGSWEIVGTEMQSHVSFLVPNFLHWLKITQKLNVREHPAVVELSDDRIFQYPILFITGHFHFNISPKDIDNLREYIRRGGFLYVEDCGGVKWMLTQYGRFADQIREVLKTCFPEGEFRVLPFDHDIYKYPYRFPGGLPNFFGVDNDHAPPDTPGKPRKGRGGEGFFVGDTMVAYLGDADTCCGWSGRDPARYGAFKIGANVVIYAMTHQGLR